ncbi:MAG: hypothetical protein A2049_09165 [Elusimicrobia bacterium GWA2_62_23]|nr:MAG: hypothetical protein A2049_09165 [Elusimicrobia bacterium GWA2_62_23]
MARAFLLEGSSMLPVFRPGGLAFVIDGRPSPGDCAVYSYKGRTLLHRVLRTTSRGAWLADDAGRLEPHLVPWKNVRGRATGDNFLARGLAGLVYSRCRRTFSRLLNV